MELHLKASHKPIKDYYASLEAFHKLGVKHEGAVRSAFQSLLESCSRAMGWTFVPEYRIEVAPSRAIRVDGGVIDFFKIPHAYWEAKDSHDDLPKEIQAKFLKGYPRDNILFQAPERAILWQDGRQVCDEDITKPDALVWVVRELFTFRTEIQRDWELAVEEFKKRIPEAAKTFIGLIEKEKKENQRFRTAFETFGNVCRTAINPNLADAAIQEMLVQHLLTERIFRRVFENSEFTKRNIIAHEIEKVIEAMVSQSFSKEEFLRDLDRFYVTLEKRAADLGDYHQKQTFLNTVYEKFFQGYAVKVADTHGIVYTPQPIVDFMVRSVEEILKKEFGKSLSDEGVHIIDPFVGTGNFITRIMREIKTTALPRKYENELHCNEVMLLPYYIASMNIEHEYYERTGQYKPFEGICLVDTFELAEDKDRLGRTQVLLFTEENTERVDKLRKTKLFVIIGNPPYNAWQVNENDNNKKRPYPAIDGRVRDTYSKDGTATNRNALSDSYVKAIRWASDKILENGEGLVAFVSNDSFVGDITFDGMRKHLGQDFNAIYVVDLKGNIRKDSMRDGIPLGEKHTVFGLSAMVGVSVSFFVKRKGSDDRQIFYAETDFRSTRLEKFRSLEKARHIYNLDHKLLQPDQKHTWLTEGLQIGFGDMLPLSARLAQITGGLALFSTLTPGLQTNRDVWCYNFDPAALENNMKRTIATYNRHVGEWSHVSEGTRVDDFVLNDDSEISWSSSLKSYLRQGKVASFDRTHIRRAVYRPFCEPQLYFDQHFTHRRGLWGRIFPDERRESANLAICVKGPGGDKPFLVLMTNRLTDVSLVGFGTNIQGFSFYTYGTDGTNERENITDWAVEQFSAAVATEVDKWQIFYYVYGLLHSPEYRKKYEANLKRELPRIPLPKNLDYFRAFAVAGERLADLHVNYEDQPEYPLEKIETPGKQLNWRVQKMKLTKDKQAIVYNELITLAGIPPEVFEYRLGNRSALEWIVDRYQVRVDKRSGIVNDPNRPDDPEYIVRLIGKVITVSLETVKIVKGLPGI